MKTNEPAAPISMRTAHRLEHTEIQKSTQNKQTNPADGERDVLVLAHSLGVSRVDVERILREASVLGIGHVVQQFRKALGVLLDQLDGTS